MNDNEPEPSLPEPTASEPTAPPVRESTVAPPSQGPEPAATPPEVIPPIPTPTRHTIALSPPPVTPRKRTGLKVFLWLLLTALLGAGVYAGMEYWKWRQEWVRLVEPQPGLPPTGGKKFTIRLDLPVTVMRQNDPRWGSDPLASVPGDTLGAHGCAVASAAMVMHYYGIDTDPQRLNDFLKLHDGYTPQGWLKWECAAETSAAKDISLAYEDNPSYQLIDNNLVQKNPVIARIRFSNGTTHFVVICGKDGYDYLIKDPGAKANRGTYPLKEFGSNIEAIRFYKKLLTK